MELELEKSGAREKKMMDASENCMQIKLDKEDGMFI